ncbi:MAG: hypothetical protein JSU91_07015, partial [Thermoplasmatales archaeon]
NISVSTNAKAINVSAYVFLNSNLSENFTLYLYNVQDNIIWKSNDFSFNKTGDWTIIISSRDWADYDAPDIKHAFFVGKPDVEIKNISISTIRTPISQKIYINDIVNITAGLRGYDANVEDVNVTLKIIDVATNIIIFTQYTEITIYIDIANYVYFSWEAELSGKFNITIILDPDDLIDENKEDNNQLTKTITVIDIPDLAIIDIKLPAITISEFDKVKIDVVIKNLGFGDATDYELKLYIEEEIQGFMKYLNDVNSVLISVKSNSTKTIGIYWNSSKAGRWLVGAKVLVNETNKDTDITNNRFLCEDILVVNPIERNPPTILNVKVEPKNQQQGGTVSIAADITDETGLKSVFVNITNPKGTIFNINMGRTVNDEFRLTFTNTDEVGSYLFKIYAVDITLHNNTATSQGDFSIFRESEPPIISFFDAEPRVQLKGESVDITCLASDNFEIKSVIVTITTPSTETYDRNMNYISEERYVYSDTYDTTGKYIFKVEVSDKANNVANSIDKTFWITSNIDDKDNDGIPDWWEEKYDLDSEDPDDAKYDPDKDGFSNLDEYKRGTNPKKDIFSENAVYRIKENSLYLSGSIVLFLVLFILSIFSKRRKLL